MQKPDLPLEFWQKLADVQPHGREVTAEQVQSWFEIVWPQYSERRYRQHRRAIASWWSRVWESDIEKAVERLEKINERESIKRLERRLPQAPEPESIPDFTQKLKVVKSG